MTQIVVMPGGFHPFHAGHLALYQSAQKAFPRAQVFVAATNDTSTRPFPFPVKEKLAKLAGVEPGHFVQVKSPFRAEEITSRFNPEKDVLIFVRSEKDADKPPQAGGVKRDGSPSYLQPLAGQTRYEPFAKHAYMAYLPTVEFGPGMTSATEIRGAWPQLDERRKTALVMSLYPKTQGNAKLAATVVGLLDAAIGSEQGVAEGFSDIVKGVKRKVAGKTDPKEVEHMYGRIARSAIKHKTPDQAEKDIERYNKVAKVVNKEGIAEGEQEALAYATQAHAGQTRSGGDPYITHPMRVADHIRQYKQSHNLDALISAAYLHDTIEDTDTTQEALHDLFGGLVASLVKELTSDPEEIKRVGKAQYLSHKMAAMSSYGLVLKLADRLDNVKDITTARTPQWRAKYAAETNQILDYIEKTRALSGTHNKLIGLIRAKLAELDQPQPNIDENQGWAATYETSAQNFVGGMTAGYQDRENQPVAEQDQDYIEEKWSQKYKSSINCADPQGFSQKAHCAGRKK